jgi:hypothetical protein
VAKTAQGLKGMVPPKNIIHKTLDFYFLKLKKLQMVLHDVTFNVTDGDLNLKPLILLKKNCNFHSVEVLNIDLLSLKKF